MPVVMSYQDIGALAQLSELAGYQQFAQADQNRAAMLVANRQQQDTQRMALETQRQQADADRRLQAQLFNREQQQEDQQFSQSLGYRYDALAQDQGQFNQQLAAQQYGQQLQAQTRIASDLLGYGQQQTRDQQLHDYRMQEIDRRGQYSQQTRAADGGFITPQGVPDKDYATREVQRFGQLIPYNVGSAVSGGDAQRRREQASEQALGFSQLPTAQLQEYIKKRPSDPWAPYLRAVVQARASVEGGQQGRGAIPEGGFGQQQPTQQMPGALRGGSYGLDQLDDAELMELANNPELMQRYFSGQ